MEKKTSIISLTGKLMVTLALLAVAYKFGQVLTEQIALKQSTYTNSRRMMPIE